MKLPRAAYSAALATGLSPWLAQRKSVRRILMLHGVDEVVLPVAAFETGLAWLAERFRIVPLHEMATSIAEGRDPGRGGELALTFDDGLRNQVDLAYPVLKRLGLPATFFVCPELIESRRWIWNQEARSRLHSLTPAALAGFARACGAPVADVEAMVKRMKVLPLADRIREEEQLRATSPDFVPSPLEKQRFEPLSWDDLDRLDPSLITIGSHTLSHPILPSLDDATLAFELTQSRQILEKRLARTVDLFCYPNGDSDRRVRAAVDSVYRAAVTTEYGFVTERSELRSLPRIPFTGSLPLLAWRMHRPSA
jgi:peptidoglycan/xylan/chitin deacetylase (PgdA/CDA1 family)